MFWVPLEAFESCVRRSHRMFFVSISVFRDSNGRVGAVVALVYSDHTSGGHGRIRPVSMPWARPCGPDEFGSTRRSPNKSKRYCEVQYVQTPDPRALPHNRHLKSAAEDDPVALPLAPFLFAL